MPMRFRAAVRLLSITVVARRMTPRACHGFVFTKSRRTGSAERMDATNRIESGVRYITVMSDREISIAKSRIGVATVLSMLLMSLVLSSCASDVTRVAQKRRLDDVDLVRMTDQMAASLAADAEVLSATSAGRIAVVILPVRNRLTGQVLPPGEAQAFVARVRVLLSRSARDRFLFVLNRDDFDALRRAELAEDLGPSPEAISPTHALTATFLSLDSSAGRRDATYYLCQYELTDLTDRRVLWAEKYEVKKKSVGEFLD
jgi:hypothetical protein